MQAIERKVGTRIHDNAKKIEWLFDWDELLTDENGEYYDTMLAKGLRLDLGKDYNIVDSTGNPTTLKTGSEKARKELVVTIAETLNVPTSVTLPPNGQDVSVESRSWVAFRPRVDTPFRDEAAKTEYITKNS